MTDPRYYDSTLLYRALLMIWGGGSLVFLAEVLIIGIDPDVRTQILMLIGLGLTVAVALALGRPQLPGWAFGVTQYIGIAIVTSLVALEGVSESPLALFYMWLLVLAAYFDRWRYAVVQGIVMSGAYAAVLVAVSNGGFPLMRWVMVVTTTFAVGTLVALLRSRVAALLDRLHGQAQTDELTGLGNRRALLEALEQAVATATPDRAVTVALFDLDRFKQYNDAFGHPAGDALLSRLSARLAEAIAGAGLAYRLGGDEFCAVLTGDTQTRAAAVERATAALGEQGEGFSVSSSTGVVEVPTEAATGTQALAISDQRLYSDKVRSHPARQRTLLKATEPTPAETWVSDVAVRSGLQVGLAGEQLDTLSRAVQLRDIGKIAIPDELLETGKTLTPEQRDFLQSYVLIGERMLQASPALHAVAEIVRAAQEHWDGTGYPDGLAGDQIPLASRIVAVCSHLDGQEISDRRSVRSLQRTIDELRAGAGTQFDPEIVQLVCDVLTESWDQLQLAAVASDGDDARALA